MWRPSLTTTSPSGSLKRMRRRSGRRWYSVPRLTVRLRIRGFSAVCTNSARSDRTASYAADARRRIASAPPCTDASAGAGAGTAGETPAEPASFRASPGGDAAASAAGGARASASVASPPAGARTGPDRPSPLPLSARSPAPAPASAAGASVRSATARVSSTASAAASPPASSPRTPSATAATAIAIPAPIRYFFIRDIGCSARSLRSVPPSVAGTRPADRRSCRGRAGRPRRGPPALDPTGSMHRARPCGLEPPRSLPADQVDRVEPDQHFPRLRPVRRTQDPGGVQLVDDTRCPAVPDPEPSLQERGRALLVLDADLGRLSEERVALLRERVRALLGGLGLVCAD